MDRDLGEGLRVRAYLADSLPMTATLNSRYPLLLGFGRLGQAWFWDSLGRVLLLIFFSTVFSRRALTYALQRASYPQKKGVLVHVASSSSHTRSPQLLGIYIKITLGHRS